MEHPDRFGERETLLDKFNSLLDICFGIATQEGSRVIMLDVGEPRKSSKFVAASNGEFEMQSCGIPTFED